MDAESPKAGKGRSGDPPIARKTGCTRRAAQLTSRGVYQECTMMHLRRGPEGSPARSREGGAGERGWRTGVSGQAVPRAAARPPPGRPVIAATAAEATHGVPIYTVAGMPVGPLARSSAPAPAPAPGGPVPAAAPAADPYFGILRLNL